MIKTVEDILKNSDKAEFLEFTNEQLPNCMRAIVMFETRDETTNKSNYESRQIGFKQEYEIEGFLEYNKRLFTYEDEETEEDN